MIEVRRLSFTYAGTSQPAVRDLNFGVKQGEIFGFLGPSGAGKSTTQKILIGLLKGFQGEVSVFGRDITTWRSDYYERIGVSFETPNHFLKLTALENLTYFGALHRGKMRPPQVLLEMVGLEDDGHLLVSQFSKGMKNRLNIARALLHDPELLFFDEPTAGLDPVNARRIKDLIKAQKEAGKTIFLTTHNMTAADELCDRVAFLTVGQIKLIDTPHELKLRFGESRVQIEYRVNSHVEQQTFPLAGLGDNAEFLQRLRNHTIQTIHSQEATLEDIFIQVTGQRL
jgi:fluoroquinolone transport system ATP-binding protein